MQLLRRVKDLVVASLGLCVSDEDSDCGYGVVLVLTTSIFTKRGGGEGIDGVRRGTF